MTLPFAKYVVVEVYLSGGQTSRIKCKEFKFNLEGDTTHKWAADGVKRSRTFSFVPKDIIGFKVIRRTWW